MTEVDITTPIVTMPEIKPGMVIRVHEKIEDFNAKGERRERVQIFEGLVLGIRGSGTQRSFTVRKETDGFGVEKIYPVKSPNIVKVEIVRTLHVRRAKLSFIKGFGRRLKEVIVGRKK